MSRRSVRSDDVVESILDRLCNGEPLASICRSAGFPHPSTWRDWCSADQSLAIAYAQAREVGFDAIAAECLEIADTPLEGEERTTKPNGDEEVKRGDMLGHRKLQIETRLKLLAKWDPKRYGDMVKVGDPNGEAVGFAALVAAAAAR